MTLRKKVVEELQMATRGQKKKKKEGGEDVWGWLPWRKRAERLRARSRRCLGEVEMSIDDRACVVSDSAEDRSLGRERGGGCPR